MSHESNRLTFECALSREDLLSVTVINQLRHWPGSGSMSKIKVAQIDPKYAGGNDFCEYYSVPKHEGANTVIVEAIRGEKRQLAACVTPVDYKVDLNKKVRKILGARRVSLAPKDEVLTATDMEYGSITPIGLPANWVILLDSRLAGLANLVIGAGKVNAKLSLPSELFLELPQVEVVDDLGISLTDRLQSLS